MDTSQTSFTCLIYEPNINHTGTLGCCPMGSSVLAHPAPPVRVASLARSYESAGELPRFTFFGADVASPAVLAAMARQIAFHNEIILLCGDGRATGSPNALNTVLQFYALRLAHVLFVSDSAESCSRLATSLPQLACVWTSRVSRQKPDNAGGCVKRFWDMRFYFYDVRKHIVAQLAGELGFNVLQTDSDVAWFANPYPMLKTGAYATANIIAQVSKQVSEVGW